MSAPDEAARRAAADFEAGRTPSVSDLEAAGLFVARYDGCTCDPDRLRSIVSYPDDGDPRPLVTTLGHANSCTAWQMDCAPNN